MDNKLNSKQVDDAFAATETLYDLGLLSVQEYEAINSKIRDRDADED